MVLLIGFVTAQSAGDACTVVDPLREGLYAPVSTNCGQYLQCDNGVYVLRLCPGGSRNYLSVKFVHLIISTFYLRFTLECIPWSLQLATIR